VQAPLLPRRLFRCCFIHNNWCYRNMMFDVVIYFSMSFYRPTLQHTVRLWKLGTTIIRRRSLTLRCLGLHLEDNCFCEWICGCPQWKGTYESATTRTWTHICILINENNYQDALHSGMSACHRSLSRLEGVLFFIYIVHLWLVTIIACWYLLSRPLIDKQYCVRLI
jgi:hypothetical protein